MTAAVFVLSTGRCGTQWLARLLSASLGESALVTHEPLHSFYAARLMLGAKEPARLPGESRAAIENHTDWIHKVLQSSTYVETGHPCWSSIPYLIETFRPNVRIVHLVRHPVPTALSWLTHQAFCRPLLPHLSEKVLLTPFDEGVQFPEYRERWQAMSPYEKVLYYWAEVNALGLSLERTTDVPWLRVQFENLLRGQDLERLFEFIGLAAGQMPELGLVDDYRAITRVQPDPRMIEQHSVVLRVAAELGYAPSDFDEPALRARYLGT